MKAYNLHDIGDFRFEEVDVPEINSNIVLVKVKACGICGSDVPRVYKNGTYHFPTIIGHEFSGQVEETGYDVDPKWKGKPVGIFPLIPCMKCACCQDKKFEMCSDYNYLGSRTNGGFAEYVAVPEWNLIELPDSVSYEQAAMLEPMAVAVHAIRQSKTLENVSKDDPVVVAGLGTIGLLLAMFLKEAGFRNILGVGNKDFQKKCFVELGFLEEQFCNVKNQSAVDFILNKTDKAGCQVFFECVGNNETLNLGLQALAPGGFLQLVGNPAGDMNLSQNDYWKILRRQITVTGTWNSSFTHNENDDWNYVINKLESGAIHPEKLITHRFPLEQIEDGFKIMRDKTEHYIKVMGIFGGN